ncbi:patatin-like phospholipase family protein [Stylonychia lemnae]|uniref:Patatin-like phospholipase family protein n=1 Tax=Stylonychia lemnae TaxID=5949 RepID=A0A077ZV54_STYLE|nr:patatin-like phospholipase family protein [Stylonychia lemnae]|eukprot:CDW73180.1 patatin-like phospholipase family protein [Stylonychia lemnae]
MFKLLISIFSLNLFLIEQTKTQSSKDKQDICYGLVLKGGANRGAYEAGAIKALVDKLESDKVQYDVVSGISVGALNAAHVASYVKGDEKLMAEDLVYRWKNMTSDKLFQSWRFGFIEGLFYHQGLLDNSPLHEYLNKSFAARPCCKRKIHFNSVDTNSGNIVSFDEKTLAQDLIKGLVATSSVPFVFPGLKIQDTLMIDGGVAWNLDVASAILKCREVVDSDSKIVLDIIDVDRKLDKVKRLNYTTEQGTIKNIIRYLEIKKYHHRMNDMIEIETAHPDVKVRYRIIPKYQLDPVYKELTFDENLIDNLIQQGYDDAIEAIDTQKERLLKYR